MKTIYKYKVNLGKTELRMPKGYKILSLQVQHGAPQIWALIDANETEQENFEVNVYGTGHSLPDDPGEHISTFKMDGGNLIFHAFKS